MQISYFEVAAITPSTITHPEKLTLEDWGVLFTMTVALGSAGISYLLYRSKAQAQELDLNAMGKISEDLERVESRIEKMVGKLDVSLDRLSEKITSITEKVATIEARQIQQVEALRIKQEFLEQKINDLKP